MIWAREQVIFALNVPGRRQKGQLEAFGDFARLDTRYYGRHRKRTLNIDGRWYCQDTDPVYAVATARYGVQPDIINEDAFRTAWLRRKIYSLDDYQRAWVLFSYSGKGGMKHLMLVTEYIWLQVYGRLKGKRITDRMTGNLIALSRAAAWNASVMLGLPEGGVALAPSFVAQQIGVRKNTWSQHYKDHWNFMHQVCAELDHDALMALLDREKAPKNGEKNRRIKINLLK